MHDYSCPTTRVCPLIISEGINIFLGQTTLINMGDNAIVDGIAVKFASPFVESFVVHPSQDDITILEELHMVDNVFCASDKAGVEDA